MPAETFTLQHDGKVLVLKNNPTEITNELCEDMFEEILLTTELFFVTDPREKPEWLLLPENPEPLLPNERRALQFVVEFMSDYGDEDPDFLERLKGFLVRPKKAA